MTGPQAWVETTYDNCEDTIQVTQKLGVRAKWVTCRAQVWETRETTAVIWLDATAIKAIVDFATEVDMLLSHYGGEGGVHIIIGQKALK